ncbi:hypothetical protein TCAL_13924 [Tigriopus californicus]|uniref:Methyltransferase domain-containing protein n=1 Tax=Tigriopus californicus TaxID=6832 RepID=A0A553PBP7_TIGCA|nr:uncharacterized protein LOC131893557 [Tigriopus californicus]TRY75104.1 hypothetical protein TCAL_13924 [Tigriopus californicus]
MDGFQLYEHYRNIGMILAEAEAAEKHAHLFHENQYQEILEKQIIKCLDASPHHRVVDLGAGSCAFASRLAKSMHLKHPILCVDDSAAILHLEHERKHIETLNIDPVEFARKDLAYDRLYVLGAVHHFGVDHLPDIFSGIFRHLSADGKLVVEKPDKEFMDLPLFDKALAELNKMDIMPTKDFITLLTKAGFKHFKIIKFRFTFRTSKNWIFEKIRERAFLCLGSFTHEEIEEGIRELEKKWQGMDEITFTPEKDIIVADKTEN